MMPVDKIIRILHYYGPQTYEDMVIQGLHEDEEKLNVLVDKGIIQKNGEFFSLIKNDRNHF
ncbi:MAG: hypothetical protein ACOWWR_00415 [Eubacteriales bacterium]